jgi:hypothetical protein
MPCKQQETLPFSLNQYDTQFYFHMFSGKQRWASKLCLEARKFLGSFRYCKIHKVANFLVV